MSGQFTYGSNKKLKSRKAIEQLFSDGRRFTVPPVRVVYRASAIPGVRFGVTVSSRLFKHATDRNRVKRILRECWRLQQAGLKTTATSAEAVTGLDIFFIYTRNTLPVFQEMQQVTSRILQQLNQQLYEQ